MEENVFYLDELSGFDNKKIIERYEVLKNKIFKKGHFVWKDDIGGDVVFVDINSVSKK